MCLFLGCGKWREYPAHEKHVMAERRFHSQIENRWMVHRPVHQHKINQPPVINILYNYDNNINIVFIAMLSHISQEIKAKGTSIE